MIDINKTIITIALAVSIAALVLAPLLQPTGMVSEPLATEKLPKFSMLRKVAVQSGFLEFLNLTLPLS